jgi:hypothetical protein
MIKEYRLVFKFKLAVEDGTEPPTVEDVRNVIEGSCPSAMVSAICDFIDSEEDEGADTVTLDSIEEVPA